MTPPSDAPIDPSVVASLRALQDPDQPDLLIELIDLFLLADAPARIAAVRIAAVHAPIGGGDAVALRRGAHALKGSAANLGAVRLAALSAKLERMGNGGSVDGAAAIGPKLAHEYDHVATALRAERRPM